MYLKACVMIDDHGKDVTCQKGILELYANYILWIGGNIAKIVYIEMELYAKTGYIGLELYANTKYIGLELYANIGYIGALCQRRLVRNNV
jgi:hypothetical protein